MKQFKASEILLLLLPILVLAGAGLYLQGRQGVSFVIDAPDDAPLEMESVRKLEVTPYEVSQGYDTKYEVVLKHQGLLKPKWWAQTPRIYYHNDLPVLYFRGENGDQPVWSREFDQKVRTNSYHVFFDPEKNRYFVEYLLPLVKVPPQVGQVILKGTIRATPRKAAVKSTPLELEVRKAGETIQVPKVSRDPHLKLVAVDVMPLGAYDAKLFKTNTQLSIAAYYEGQNEPSQSMIFTGELIDEKGNACDSFTTISSGADWSDPSIHQFDTKRWVFGQYHFSLDQVPKGIRKIYFRTRFTINGEWPLEIKVPVWENGKVLYNRPVDKPSKLSISQPKANLAPGVLYGPQEEMNNGD